MFYLWTLLIIYACAAAGQWFLAALAAAVSVITLIYFMKAMRFSIFGGLPEALNKIKEVPLPMAFSVITLAVICLAVGIIYLVSPDFSDMLLKPGADILLDGLKNNASSYISAVLGG